MTPTPEDYEAATRIIQALGADVWNAAKLRHLIATALAEAVRVALEQAIGEIECRIEFRPTERVVDPVFAIAAIRGLMVRARTEAQATPAPLRHLPECDSWSMDAVKQRPLQCNCTPEVMSGTPPETKERG